MYEWIKMGLGFWTGGDLQICFAYPYALQNFPTLNDPEFAATFAILNWSIYGTSLPPN